MRDWRANLGWGHLPSEAKASEPFSISFRIEFSRSENPENQSNFFDSDHFRWWRHRHWQDFNGLYRRLVTKYQKTRIGLSKEVQNFFHFRSDQTTISSGNGRFRQPFFHSELRMSRPSISPNISFFEPQSQKLENLVNFGTRIWYDSWWRHHFWKK